MKKGGKNKSVAFIILCSVYGCCREFQPFCVQSVPEEGPESPKHTTLGLHHENG